MQIDQIDQLLTTTRSVRRRLDLDRPVPRSTILECLSIAIQAPTGGNSQGWRFLVIDDEEKRRAIAEIYRDVCTVPFEAALAKASDPGARSAYSGALYLSQVLDRVPVLVIPCIKGTLDAGASPAGLFGSIIPATWSFQLALRARGLGSCYTTVLVRRAKDVGELLGIPDSYIQTSLIPVAYTIGTQFKSARRSPVSEVAFLNEWRSADV
jgi:nitroreductase